MASTPASTDLTRDYGIKYKISSRDRFLRDTAFCETPFFSTLRSVIGGSYLQLPKWAGFDFAADLCENSACPKAKPALIPLDFYPCVIPFMLDFDISLCEILVHRIFLLHVLQNVRGSKPPPISLCKVRLVDHYLHAPLLVQPLSM
jgi:hypothetical protein